MNGWYYRDEARRCRERGAFAKDGGTALSWLRIAKGYDQLASEIEARERVRAPLPSTMRQQPVQQPQSKATPEPEK